MSSKMPSEKFKFVLTNCVGWFVTIAWRQWFILLGKVIEGIHPLKHAPPIKKKCQ